MLPIKAHANIEQLLDGFCKVQDAFGVDRPFGFGHPACVDRGQRAGDGFLITEKLIQGGWGYARLLGDSIGRGFVIAQAAEDCGCRAKEILLALLAARVALAVGIEDGHRMIFAEKSKNPSKNLHPFPEYKYLLA